MKAITKIVFVTVMLCLSLGAKAVAITNPVITLNPTSIVLNQSNTWTFDFTSSSLTGSENLVIYFWQPAAHASVALTNLGGKKWSFTFTPTTFFGLTQAEIAADVDQFWFNIQDGVGGQTGSLHTTFATPVATTAPVSIVSNPLGTYPLDQSVTWTFDLTGSGFKAGQDIYMYAWSPTNPDPTYSNSTAVSKLTYVSGMVWSKTLTPTTYFTQTVEQIQASAGFWMKLKDQTGKIETAVFTVLQTIKGTSTISVSGTSSLTYSGSPQGPETVNLTGSAGTVTLAYSGTGATSYGPTATKPTNAGTYQVVASVTADASYNAATSSALAFSIAKATQTITFGALSAKTDVDAAFNLNASVNSALSVSYVISNQAVATVSGSTVTIINEGTTTITASQAGNSNYEAATSVVQTLTVTTPADFTLRKTMLIDFGSTYASTTAPDANGNYWNNINTVNANDNFALVDKTNVSTGSSLFLINTFGQSGGAGNGLSTPEVGQLNELAIASATGDYFYTGTNASFKLTGLNPSKRYKFYIFGSRVDVATRQTKFSFTGKNATAVEGTLTTSGTGIGLVSAVAYNGNTANLVTTSKLKASDAGEMLINVLKLAGANAHINVMKVEEYQQASTWNGTGNWSDANWTSTPGSSAEVTVSSGELTINQSASIDKITLAPGAKLTLGNGNTLTTTNGVTLQSDATGSATFVDTNNSSPQAVSGTVQQYLTAARNWYTTSPIAAGTAAGLNLGTSVQSYSESAKAWSVLTGSDALVAGKGYVSVAGVGTGTTGTLSFNGTLNTGTISVAVTRTGTDKAGFNLVANPYPSYLDWSLVTADPLNANIGTTMWFRTKTAGNLYTFSTYNSTGNVATANSATTTISKFIPPMQAFWVRVNVGTASTNLTLKNTMRAHKDDNGNTIKAPRLDNQQLVRLQVSNGTNSDEAVVYFNVNAQNTFDNYDSQKLFNNNAQQPEIFTMAGGEQLVINGLNELTSNTEIPLGFSTSTANNFTLSTTELKNLNGTKVILIDKQNPAVETELSEGAVYNFSSQITIPTADRFSLLFRAPGVTTNLKNTSKLNAQVFVNATNQITIVGAEKAIYGIYNAVGQLIENGILKNKIQIVNCKLQIGVYVVKVDNNSTRVIIK